MAKVTLFDFYESIFTAPLRPPAPLHGKILSSFLDMNVPPIETVISSTVSYRGNILLYPENHSLGEWFKRGCCR